MAFRRWATPLAIVSQSWAGISLGIQVGGNGAKLLRVQQEGERVHGGAVIGGLPTLPQFGDTQGLQTVHQTVVNRLHRTIGIQAFVEAVFQNN